MGLWNIRKYKKGQVPIIEEVLLFLVGIAVLVGFIYLNNVFLDKTSDYFLDIESDLQIYNIDYILLFLNNTELRGSVILNMPKKIHDKYYYLYQTNPNNIGVFIPDKQIRNLYNLSNNIYLDQQYHSGMNYFMMYVNNTGHIHARGVSNY